MTRRPRRIVISFDRILDASEMIRKQHTIWTADGYVATGARLYRCRDGSYTARVVWRNREAIVSTVTCTVQGLVIA